MYLISSSSCCILMGNNLCLETHDGIVGRVLVAVCFCPSVLDTGMWSDVLAFGVLGSHSVLVCGDGSWSVEV